MQPNAYNALDSEKGKTFKKMVKMKNNLYILRRYNQWKNLNTVTHAYTLNLTPDFGNWRR